MKFYLMTDIHLYSKRNWLADPYKWEKKSSQMQLRESEEIVREAFDIILADPETDTVIIPGDLTDNGEVTSHEDVLSILKEYTEKGLRILVTTATHDYREKEVSDYSGKKDPVLKGRSYGYDENYEYKLFVPCAQREDLRAWYAPYGRDNALSIEHKSMSYTYELDEKHRLLAINDDYNTNRKNDHRGIPDELLEWVLAECKKAKADGKTIVCVLHHPVLSPSPLYKLIGSHDIIAGSDKLAEIFADNGINVIFSGHSHVHDIEFRKSKNGNPFYDVSTGALIGYPPIMRKVEYREDGKIDVRSIVVETLSRFDLKGKSLPEYCREGFFGMIEDMVASMSGDMINFAIYADSISIRPWTVYQFWWLFKGTGLFLDKLTVGKVYKWCKKESKLTPEQVAPIKNEKVVPLILKMVQKLYAGNADIHPDSPEFSVIMGTVAILDDLVKTLGIKLKKLLGYDTLREIVEPLAYNNGIDDCNAIIDPNGAPEEKPPLPSYESKKGLGILITLILGVIVTLPILLPVGAIFAILILLRGTKTFNPYRDYKKVLPPRVNKNA